MLAVESPTLESPDALNARDFPSDDRLDAKLRGLAVKQWCICQTMAPLRHLLGRRLERAFGVITYHHVAPHATRDRGLLNVTPEKFREQIQGLLDLGYTGWPLRQVIDYYQQDKHIPRNVFVVVFDDGYANVYHNAYPVLRQLGVPATIFLATAYLDSRAPFPFDNWTASRGPANLDPALRDSWRPLATEECREMLESGCVDLGSHTHTHRDFRGREAEFRDDLRTSLEVLGSRFGLSEATFSFPYGFCPSPLIDVARDLGLRCGLSADCQLITPELDPYRWGRFGATQLDSGSTLAAKLDGWYSLLQNGWRRLRGVGR